MWFKLKKGEGVQIQSINRAVEILNYFRSETELGISDLAALMDLGKSTVYGLVNTLCSNELLEQNPSTKKYHLGMRLFEYGQLVQDRLDIRREAEPYCSALAAKYPVSVRVVAYSNGEVVYIDKYDNKEFSVAYTFVGKRAPMYCTGVGKAILAFLPDPYLQRYIFSKPMQKFTESTITDPEALQLALQEVRRSGFAVDNGEIVHGLMCIASTVFDIHKHPINAISASFPIGRLSETQIESLTDDLTHAARQISRRFGYPF